MALHLRPQRLLGTPADPTCRKHCRQQPAVYRLAQQMIG
jgi:hypothetical protein